MREDIYGPKLWAIIQQATEPVTAHALTTGAGCSKQRTYQWLTQAKELGVREVGRNSKGAALFAYAPSRGKRAGTGNRAPADQQQHASINGESETHATATTTLSIDPATMLGLELQVTGVRLSTGGGYVLELAGDEGVSIQVHMQQTDQAGQQPMNGAIETRRGAHSTAKH